MINRNEINAASERADVFKKLERAIGKKPRQEIWEDCIKNSYVEDAIRCGRQGFLELVSYYRRQPGISLLSD
jgi:hypothetical protein